MLNQFTDPNKSAALTTTVAAIGVGAKYAYNSISKFAFESFNYGPVGYVTDALFKSAPKVVTTENVSQVAQKVVEYSNPFELMRTCPTAENVCGVFDNVNTFFPYGEYLAQAGNYLPFIAQGAQLLRSLNDVRHGNYLTAARRATLVGSQALIQYLSPEYGLVALPVSMVVNQLFDRAGRRRDNAISTILSAPTFDGTSAALSLGVEAQPLDNGQFQLVIDGEEIGDPVSSQALQGLATYTSALGLVNFEKVAYDYEKQTVTLDDSDVAIPFSEIESLFKLTHEDLPTLVQLGVVDLSVSDEGKVTLTLNEDKLPGQKNLTFGQQKFVGLLQKQSDKSLSVAANREDFAADPKSAQEITSYLDSGLVPIQTSQGLVLSSPAVVGAAVAKGLKIEDTLRNPKEDGSLVLKFKAPARKRDGVLRNSSDTVEVPVRDAQRVAAQIAVEVKSLYQQQEELLRSFGF